MRLDDKTVFITDAGGGIGSQFFEAHDNPDAARKRMEAQYPLKRLGT